MPKMIGTGLSRREREAMEALHRLGAGTAVEVMDSIKAPPSYSAVRSVLRILEEKGHIVHEEDGKRYVYRPALHRKVAARDALLQVVNTFFAGSLSNVVKTFLDEKDAELTDFELNNLSEMIERARKEQEAK
jgi:predicted transcriptional regulator